MALVIEGEERIAAPLQKVREGLNDPAILKEAIPGCQGLEKKSNTEMAATVVPKIGSIKRRRSTAGHAEESQTAAFLYDPGRRQGRYRRLRQGRRRCDAGCRRCGHDDPEICGDGRCRRQDRPARQPADPSRRRRSLPVSSSRRSARRLARRAENGSRRRACLMTLLAEWARKNRCTVLRTCSNAPRKQGHSNTIDGTAASAAPRSS